MMKIGARGGMGAADVREARGRLLPGAMSSMTSLIPDLHGSPRLSSRFDREHAYQSRLKLEVPSRRPKGGAMEIVFARCAGLDVHSKTVVVCRRLLGPDGTLDKQVRTFGTTTGALRALAAWLTDGAVTHVAMESTGVFWKPVWNILEERFTILLVNARHIKQVPGRKTDVKDCEWIGQLLQHGLLRGSFVPPVTIRELRDLTRHRAKLVDQRPAVPIW